MEERSLRRPGVTLLEILVVLAIIGLLAGLLIAGIQKAREAALRVQSMNNLKQIIIATHTFAATRSGNLPSIDRDPWSPNGGESVFVALLPYVGQGNAYSAYGAQNLINFPVMIKTYISPADPTIPNSDWTGVSSYAANAQVFQGSPGLPRTFADGTQNTIAFAEHYAADCRGRAFFFGFPGEFSDVHRATFADGGPDVDHFANAGDDYPVTSGWPPTSTGAWEGTFQAAPRQSDCNPVLANSPHRAGMLVALGDGSVRLLSSGMSPTTYWGAVTPAGGEVLGGDW